MVVGFKLDGYELGTTYQQANLKPLKSFFITVTS